MLCCLCLQQQLSLTLSEKNRDVKENVASVSRAHKLSGYVAHGFSGRIGIPGGVSHETDRSVTADPDHEI